MVCWAPTSSSSPPSATSATSPGGPTRCPRPTRVRAGPASASTWTTASSPSMWCRPRRSRSWPTSSVCSRTPTSCISPPTRTARASRSPGTSSRCCRPPSRSSAWSSTRSRPEAIARAVEEWRDLDRRLVDAQEARRILDRLYGYEVSPVLWRKVMPRLSAGRVQSVATRMVVERERARMRFHSATWWGIDGTFAPTAAPRRRAAPVRRRPRSRSGAPRWPPARTSTRTACRRSKGAVRVLVEEEATSVGHRAGRPVLHRQRGHRAALPALARRRRS